MKSIPFAVLVFGIAVLGSAQTSPEVGHVRAASIARDGDMAHLRGNVEVVVGTIRVTADEADLPASPAGVHQIDLRGNVHMAAGSGAMLVETYRSR